MKRLLLFVAMLAALLPMVGAVLRLSGLERLAAGQGITPPLLLLGVALVAMAGALASLLLSRRLARWATGARLLQGNEGRAEHLLVDAAWRLSRQAGLRMPQVAVCEGAPNAFAIGPSRDRALLVVSRGMLASMSADEIEGVLGHELAHVASGDMVTLTLLNGLLNTFVELPARAVGMLLDRRAREPRDGAAYRLVQGACQLAFGLPALLVLRACSRRREYRADQGSADLLGSSRPIIAALRFLDGVEIGELPPALRSFGIAGRRARWRWFDSHPVMLQRLHALRALGRRPQFRPV